MGQDSIEALTAIERNPQADAAIGAWSTHSYNMASTRAMALASRNKPRWVTEAGQGVSDSAGPQAEVNAMDAPTVAARFLTDLNDGVSRWMYFIGMQSDAARLASGNSRTALVVASPSRGDVVTYNRYAYLKQLLETFPPGSVFHACSSSLDGAMDWTYGQKPRASAACAEAPDGRLRLAAVNTTGIVDSNIARYYPAQTLELAFDLPWPNKAFNTYITGTDAITRSAGSIRPGTRQAWITLKPFEMATLVQV